MIAVVRRKLAMAARARDFALAHPLPTSAGYTSLVSRLVDRIARGDALASQEDEGSVGERASIRRRSKLRNTIREELRLLSTTAQFAVTEHPELEGRFLLPESQAPHKRFITAADNLLSRGEAQQALFISLGLGETFFADLRQVISEFDAATTTAHTGKTDHVGARGDLLAVTREISLIVRMLDALNQKRFRNDNELLTAWNSVRHVVGPFRTKPEPSTGPVVDPKAAA